MVKVEKRSLLSVAVTPALLLLILVAVFGMVRLRSGIIALEYEIGELEAKKSDFLVEKKSLEARLASVISLSEIEGRGLGLLFPDRQDVVYVVSEPGAMARAASHTMDSGARFGKRQ